MLGLLADANAGGHLRALLIVCDGPSWRSPWSATDVHVFRLERLGLPPTVADDVLWRPCQQNNLVLLTANRNRQGSDSLGETIARENTPQSLPVVTLANAERVLLDRAYCDRAAERLIEILMEIDRPRGAGRLWIP
jgi:hypothetical protein